MQTNSTFYVAKKKQIFFAFFSSENSALLRIMMMLMMMNTSTGGGWRYEKTQLWDNMNVLPHFKAAAAKTFKKIKITLL